MLQQNKLKMTSSNKVAFGDLQQEFISSEAQKNPNHFTIFYFLYTLFKILL